MVVLPITPSFAAEVGDVNLATVDDNQFEEIEQAFWRYSVLVLPDQHLSIDQHLEFARRLGPLEMSVAQYRPGAELRVPAEISDVSNLESGDKIWAKDSPRRLHERGNRLWHTDSSFPAHSCLRVTVIRTDNSARWWAYSICGSARRLRRPLRRHASEIARSYRRTLHSIFPK